MQPWLTPPNLLTYGRIVLTPFAAWQISAGNYPTAFWLLLIAGLSDGVDGFLARNFGWQTKIGAYLDPLADKFLLISVYVALTIAGALPLWLLLLVLARDVWILAMVAFAWWSTDIREFPPRWLGKVSTAAQIALATALVVSNAFPGSLPAMLSVALLWLVAALAVFSGIDYTVYALIRYRSWRKTREIDASRGSV